MTTDIKIAHWVPAILDRKLVNLNEIIPLLAKGQLDESAFTQPVSLTKDDISGKLSAKTSGFDTCFHALAGPQSSDDTVSVSMLMAAVLSKQFDLAQSMIDLGAPLDHANTKKITLLLAACDLGHPEVLSWLSGIIPASQWSAPTGSYNPYASDVPIDRLDAKHPELAAQVRAQMSKSNKGP